MLQYAKLPCNTPPLNTHITNLQSIRAKISPTHKSQRHPLFTTKTDNNSNHQPIFVSFFGNNTTFRPHIIVTTLTNFVTSNTIKHKNTHPL